MLPTITVTWTWRRPAWYRASATRTTNNRVRGLFGHHGFHVSFEGFIKARVVSALITVTLVKLVSNQGA